MIRRAALSSLLALSLPATVVIAQDVTVVPVDFTSVEGNSSSSTLFQAGAASLQVFFSEDFLAAAGIVPGTVIDGLAYRRNGGGATGPAGSTSMSRYDIYMSQSFSTPTAMTATYADNVVGVQVHVHDVAMTFAASSFPGGASPNQFGPMIDLTTPYLYEGGSLLVEVRRSARAGDTVAMNTDVDNSAPSQAGVRWLFNLTSDTATTGTLSNTAQIFQFRYYLDVSDTIFYNGFDPSPE